MVAPVVLPDGAVIKKMKCYYYDKSTMNSNINVDFVRSLTTANSVDELIDLVGDNTPSSGYGSVEGTLSETVNNNGAIYIIRAMTTNGWDGMYILLFSVEITYTVNTVE